MYGTAVLMAESSAIVCLSRSNTERTSGSNTDSFIADNSSEVIYGIIAVADGRTKWDRGATLEEMALYMASKDCVWALNFDGGSSSVIADKTGSLGQNTGVAERAVNHALLAFVG